MPTIVKKIKKIATKAPVKPFSRMSKAEKRVAIAKDVIKHIKAAKFKATKGTYLDAGDVYRSGEELQKIILDAPTCKVCAIGAVFAADVIKRDNFILTDTCTKCIDSDEMKAKTSYFSKDTLHTMEVAFEKKIITDGVCGEGKYTAQGYRISYTELGKRAIAFGKNYRKSQDRLMAIMQNIIKNKGEFKP